MDAEELDELTDTQLTALDRAVENLPRDEQSSPVTRDVNRADLISLKRGRTSSFDGLTDEQLAAIDIEVENTNRNLRSKRSCLNWNESHTNQTDEDFADFGELTSTQLNSLDRQVENFNSRQQQSHSVENENERQTHNNTLTASQLELAAAVFDDDDGENGPSFDHLECLRARFRHDRFRDMQWEIIRAVMIEKRDVCAVMATGYGKSLCFQVRVQFIWTSKFWKIN